MEFENSIGKYIYNESLNIGGYPMVEILQKEIDKQNLLGGKTSNSELGVSKFIDLIIPAGLLSFSNEYYSKGGEIGGSLDKIKIKEKTNGTVDNELFNKVFDLITKCPGNSRTRKNLEKFAKKNTKKRIIIKK
uniref:Uncharacterized protein n=1 Tax=viral metagenome TaxID=1070528 RepID=A0A6C0DB00_9ZZZZ